MATQDDSRGKRSGLRYWLIALALVLVLVVVIPVLVGGLAVRGIAVRLSVGLLVTLVGLAILLLAAYVTAAVGDVHEQKLAVAKARSSTAWLGASLAAGGIGFAATGWTWCLLAGVFGAAIVMNLHPRARDVGGGRPTSI
jgi:hypothetical protein